MIGAFGSVGNFSGSSAGESLAIAETGGLSSPGCCTGALSAFGSVGGFSGSSVGEYPATLETGGCLGSDGGLGSDG